MGMTSDFADSYSVSARVKFAMRKLAVVFQSQTDTSREERKTIPATNGRVAQAKSPGRRKEGQNA